MKMERKWRFVSLEREKMVTNWILELYGGWKIDDNDTVINKKKYLWCNRFFLIFEIIK